jgi:hypothetical protein
MYAAWYFARLLLTATAAGLIGYVTFNDDVVVTKTTQKADLVNAHQFETGMTSSCWNSNIFSEGVDGIEAKLCLNSNRNTLQTFIDSKPSKCDDTFMTNYLNHPDIQLNATMSCCDRLNHSYPRLVAGVSFVMVAIFGTVVALALHFWNINYNWHIIDRLVHTIVYLVATGLLASALYFSDVSGPHFCNNSIEGYLNENGRINFTTHREIGFWLIAAGLGIVAFLALVQLSILAYPYIKSQTEKKRLEIAQVTKSLIF